MLLFLCFCFFFSSRRRHTRYWRDWSSDVCSSDLKYGSTVMVAHQGQQSSNVLDRESELPKTALNALAEILQRAAISWREPRSEERRVGKECRSRWSPDH